MTDRTERATVICVYDKGDKNLTTALGNPNAVFLHPTLNATRSGGQNILRMGVVTLFLTCV